MELLSGLIKYAYAPLTCLVALAAICLAAACFRLYQNHKSRTTFLALVSSWSFLFLHLAGLALGYLGARTPGITSSTHPLVFFSELVGAAQVYAAVIVMLVLSFFLISIRK